MSEPEQRPAEPLAQPILTLRDWFAGQALSGWIARTDTSPPTGIEAQQKIAKQCFAMADAMVAASIAHKEGA